MLWEKVNQITRTYQTGHEIAVVVRNRLSRFPLSVVVVVVPMPVRAD